MQRDGTLVTTVKTEAGRGTTAKQSHATFPWTHELGVGSKRGRGSYFSLA